MAHSAGLNRETGRLLTDFDHVVQSIGVIFTTGLGDAILREWFGFPGMSLLGKLGTATTITRFFRAIALALTIRQLNGLPAEPRFRLVKITPVSLGRDGNLEVILEGIYFPRGHLGDFTPDSGSARKLRLQSAGGILTVSGA